MVDKNNIKNYLIIINPTMNLNKSTLDFLIDETIDRVLLYLNRNDIPVQFERILAKIINANIIKFVKSQELIANNEADRAISSLSDNGQSILYSNEITNYFATAKDNELFSGFESLLSRYRRIKVVYPKNNE